MGNVRSFHVQKPESTTAQSPLFAKPMHSFAPSPLASKTLSTSVDSVALEGMPRQGFDFAHLPLFSPSAKTSTRRVDPSTSIGLGLPSSLKAGIETLSGIPMHDVRVHYNSPAPEQVQALAYTQGSDIHLRAGQEKHLAHEAWHVVQQKQGRVKSTMQLKGVEINDDGGLEHEADVMGTKALHLPFFTGSLRSPEPIRQPTGKSEAAQRLVMQRRVGFEFEAQQDTWGMKGWKNQNQQPTNADSGIQITDTKLKLYHDTASRFGVSSDNGRIEFITDPLSTWSDVKQTIAAMYALFGQWVDVNHKWYQAGTGKWAGGTGYTWYRPQTKGPLPTVPQATVGTTIMNIPGLLQAIAKGVQGPVGTYKPQWYVQSPGLLKAIDDAEKKLTQIYQNANQEIQEYAGVLKSQGKTEQEAMHIYGEAKGFLSSMLILLSQAHLITGIKPGDDVKYRFNLMHRTDFHSAYNALSTGAQNLVHILLWPESEFDENESPDSDQNKSRISTVYGKERVLKTKYKAPDLQGKPTLPGPTIEDWIDSILSPHTYRKVTGFQAELPKDIMSPPPGHRAHTGQGADEGLGAYGMDTAQGNAAPLFLYELRGLAAPVFPDKWSALAEEICRLAAISQNDAQLYPGT